MSLTRTVVAGCAGPPQLRPPCLFRALLQENEFRWSSTI